MVPTINQVVMETEADVNWGIKFRRLLAAVSCTTCVLTSEITQKLAVGADGNISSIQSALQKIGRTLRSGSFTQHLFPNLRSRRRTS